MSDPESTPSTPSTPPEPNRSAELPDGASAPKEISEPVAPQPRRAPFFRRLFKKISDEQAENQEPGSSPTSSELAAPEPVAPEPVSYTHLSDIGFLRGYIPHPMLPHWGLFLVSIKE